MPSDILKVPLISIPKGKQSIDDRAEFQEYTPRYLSEETWEEFGEYEPLPALQALLKGKEVKLYDSEKDRIKDIRHLQPKWKHPHWSERFNQKMTNVILEYPTEREPAERWMVEHINQKNVYTK